MSIDDIDPLIAVKAYGGNPQNSKKKQGDQKGGADDLADGRKSTSGPRLLDDFASFLGIPQAELTDAVHQAILSLMQEMESLRIQLANVQKHEEFLEKEVDHHPDLDVLARPALMRALSQVARRAGENWAQHSFVYIRILNLAKTQAEYGFWAAQDLRNAVGAMLKDALRLTDHVGVLGGDGFGVLMPLSPRGATKNKMDQVIAQMEKFPIVSDGRSFHASLDYAFVMIAPGEGARDIIQRADDVLRSASQQS